VVKLRRATHLVVVVKGTKAHAEAIREECRAFLEGELKLQVEVNEEKSRTVDLRRGESFGFLGFDFRRIRSKQGKWRANYTPKLKKRTALLRELKDVFRRHRSQPVIRVVEIINPKLRGWVNYFAIGNSGECFTFIKDWVEKKIRRHMMRAQKRRGFGWEQWSRARLYELLRLFNNYRVQWPERQLFRQDKSHKLWGETYRGA
jgi:RNA-directed DNA polymerase